MQRRYDPARPIRPLRRSRPPQRLSNSGSGWDRTAVFGSVVGLIGIVGAAALSLTGSTNQAEIEAQVALCAPAFEHLGDADPNPTLTEAQAVEANERALQIVRNCEKLSW